ncbi:hypothetical protein CFBP2533_23180 [Xanthomonas hortorum pv. pelargonii]|uniref:Uncharacterized protein n=2 Tax=Xanthomonas hortorum TaxID=56454 RepID=A0A6V7DFL0_9XANT|nr:hypothetical protein CFBP2533_23180 [Xanthomonas hortorum pv. pelargonii]CAD0333504.1 hypothetical protein CFBP2533_23180 [Xanthomonas hortorum pv. pelargonii]
MGLCNSKPSVAGSPARYTTRTTEQATPSESSSPSRRDSSSSSTNALRDALPSPPRRAASPEPQGSPSRQGAGWSGQEGFSGWSEYQGNLHDSAHEWQGVSTGEYPIAPADMWAPPAWNPYPTGTASSHHQALQKRAQEWANLTTTTLQHDGKDPRLAQAITHLFLIFADSPTFRQTMATIQKEGMVGIRIDPEVATAHFNPQQREVVLGEMMARDPTTAMGVLAFELSNASLDLAFKECERNAAIAQLSPRELAESIERVEYNSTRNVQAYYMEAHETLRRVGLDNPYAWHCMVTAQGHIEPSTRSEDEAVANSLATGHLGWYEQQYAKRNM